MRSVALAGPVVARGEPMAAGGESLAAGVGAEDVSIEACPRTFNRTARIKVKAAPAKM